MVKIAIILIQKLLKIKGNLRLSSIIFVGGVIEEGDDDDEPAAPQRVRIVVEGETVTELEVMNGEADMQDIQPARKFINNGILYIERNGKTYTAQGSEL